jgi:hypothetical protein
MADLERELQDEMVTPPFSLSSGAYTSPLTAPPPPYGACGEGGPSSEFPTSTITVRVRDGHVV